MYYPKKVLAGMMLSFVAFTILSFILTSVFAEYQSPIINILIGVLIVACILCVRFNEQEIMQALIHNGKYSGDRLDEEFNAIIKRNIPIQISIGIIVSIIGLLRLLDMIIR